MADPAQGPLHKPTPRHYEAQDRGRDVDAAERMTRLHALSWSLGIFIVALPLGFITVGAFWGLIAACVAGGLVYATTTAIAKGGALTAGMIHNPGGDIAPVKRDYSYAQSLAVRGDYAQAIHEYEGAIAALPEDPEPYLRIARILRRDLQQPEDALRWFKRARMDAAMNRRQELLVTQEIVELYRTALASPERAIPELARLVDRFPDMPAIDAVREELALLRQTIADRDPPG